MPNTPLLEDQHLRFRFNPFGNLSDAELTSTVVPRDCLQSMLKQLEGQNNVLLELVGPKGRGKSTHLRLLHRIFPDSLFLHADRTPNIKGYLQQAPNQRLLIDSVHRLSPIERQRLFRHFRQVALTTHLRRPLEYRLAGKPFHSFHFNDMSEVQLAEILRHRIRLAGGLPREAPVALHPQAVRYLHRRFGDDLRAILHHLYDRFDAKTLHP